METQHLIGFGLFVALTIGRHMLYEAHQRQHSQLNLPYLLHSRDKIGSRLIGFLYLVIWLGTLYALYVNEFSADSYVAGLLLVMVGVVIRLKALHDLGKNYTHEVAIYPDHQLVTTGVYRWVRHPLNLALVIELLGMVLIAQEFWILVAWVCLTLIEIRRSRLEDKILRETFGVEAKRYQQDVPSMNIFVHLFRGLRRR